MTGAPSLLVLVFFLSVGAGPAGAAERTLSASPVSSDSLQALVERARESLEDRPLEAARLYRRAARSAEPGVAAWIRLSGAQAAARAGDTAAVREAAVTLTGASAVPRDSVQLALARAAVVAGDERRGAELGRGLPGSADPTLWAERLGPALLASGDTAAARRGLLEAAEADPASAAGMALLRLGPGWRTLARLARTDRSAGRSDRAVRLLDRALEAAPAGERAALWRDRAETELSAGRPAAAHRSALRGLDAAREDRIRAELEMAAARSHRVRGPGDQAEVHLRRGLAAGGGDPSARAGYLLADMAHDRGRTRDARERYRRVARAHPRTRHGGVARMRLGLLELREGRHAAAAEHFRAYRRDRPGGGWATASVYWEARALDAAGGSRDAARTFRQVLERDPTSWYGIRSAHRLGAEPLAEVFGEDPGERSGRNGRDEAERASDGASPARSGSEGAVASPPGEDLVERMNLLQRLGWPGRALAEWAAVDVDSLAGGRPLELASTLNDAGWTGPGIRLGWSVFDRRRRWSRPLARAIWPLPHREAVQLAAASHSLPPALVAAVARQESAFDPRAVSRAGAVGLMQIMPATARELGSAEPGREPPDREALMEPGLSLELGARYLDELLGRFDGSLLGALVAYNAGPTRWRRWRRFPEARVDPELLVERIPFGETRRYVKAVLRNLYVYARLHGLDDGGRPPAAPGEDGSGGPTPATSTRSAGARPR